MNTDAKVPTQYKSWPKRLPRDLIIPETSLWYNLEASAARFPDKALYLFFGRALSFAQAKAQAEAVAGWLQSVGVKAGDRVLLDMQNCPQYAVSAYGIMRANAVVVPVNPMNRADELKHYITDSQAKVAICTVDVAAALAEASADLPQAQQLTHILATRYTDAMPEGPLAAHDTPAPAVEEWLRADPPLPANAVRWRDMLAQALPPGPHTAQTSDLAMLAYTSGTTGLPKGCMHTHRTLMANSIGETWTLLGPESVMLGVVPFFHITGLIVNVHSAIFSSMTVLVMPRWDRELAGRWISRYAVTHWTCIPTMVIDLFASPNYASFDLSSMKFMNGGGAAMPLAVAERLQSQYGVTFAEGYGLTETAAPTHMNPPDAAKLQCLGIPLYGVDSRIVDPDTLKEMPVGETGEIVTHGPMVFKGYWNHPQATADAFIEIDGKSFFRTGDLGRMDADGYFFITDRLKRMINASGFKVWPAEVESLLYKNPAVQEACIIASHDDYRGETVKAVVVLRSEARGKTTGEDIIAWSREHMAAYKVPRLVEFADALPKTASGKVLWRVLQEAEKRPPPDRGGCAG